ncbi:DNA repair protein RecN [Mammaliicoccus sciuri]|uniref:DNA repair protein RecN n=1 Tax=Mammaliicoccus sciuri TaxID=1296 RepID=UPI0022702648|nr:DNA repair protein RecN [Mammaliicoccus sciuri]MCY1028495.1 DNA repair protein RecN [Mammaliicoccus sciuri]MEB7410031.1 DNA repair protein RecN [Mammaliicoccus sciuri]
MLQALTIKQFAIIESLEINFSGGLTVLSGETGAGKSIIIDAIGQLVGARASQSFVRHGEQKATIEGVFDIDNVPNVNKILSELDIDFDEDFLFVKREIFASGKSICKLNNQNVTLSDLKIVMQELLDIHGQHETQILLKPKYHLSLLDDYADGTYQAEIDQYDKTFQSYRLKKQELEKLESQDQALLQRLDLIKFQRDELQDANLKEDEIDFLNQEIKKLQNHEKINESLNKAHMFLSSEENITDKIYELNQEIQHINDIIPDKYTAFSEELDQMYYTLEDYKHELYNELTSNDFDESLLNEYESRLNVLTDLNRKYGKSIPELIKYRDKIDDEIYKIENYEQSTSQLREEINDLYTNVVKYGEALSTKRRQVALNLRDRLVEEVQNLHMQDANIEITFTKTKPTQYGLEEVEFLISPNKGEPLKSLNKIASGGELSRIMLALKSIFVSSKGQTAILFDEVDTGVSGRVAQKMAEKMHQIAQTLQVICISHLPQVAAISDNHLYIAKETVNDRTTTSIKQLDGEDKIDEIARMISGVEVTELTRQHAKEMIIQNKNLK